MSKGMQQRLGLAQALIGAPRMLLLDEPTSALDPAGRRTVRALLEELRGRGVSVLLNSHLLSRGRAGLRPRRDHRPRRGSSPPGTPAELAHAGGVEVETGARPARVRRRRPRRRAADRPRAGGRRARGLRRARAHARRSRTPTSRRSRAASVNDGSGSSPRFTLRECAAPAGVPRGRAAHRRSSSRLYALGTWQLDRDARPGRAEPARRRARRRRRRHAARPRDVRDALPRHRARRLPHARRGARRRRARPAPAAARAAGLARGRCCSARFAAAAAVCGGLRGRRLRWPRRSSRGRSAAGGPTASCSPALGLAVGGRRSSRRSRWPGRSSSSTTANGIAVFMLFGAGLVGGPARPDRRGAATPTRCRTSPRSRAGRSRSRRSTRRRSHAPDRRHRRLHPAGHRPRPVRRRPVGRPAACGCGRSSTWASSARGLCEASRRETYETRVRPGRRLHRHAVRRQPGGGRARRRRARATRRCSASRTGRTCRRRRSCCRRRARGRLPGADLHAGRRAAVRRATRRSAPATPGSAHGGRPKPTA